MQKKTALFFGIVLLILTAGCVSIPPTDAEQRIKKPEADYKLEILGDNVTNEQKDLIIKIMSYLPEKFRKSVKVICLRDDKEHFTYYYNGEIRFASAHDCSAYGQKVCVRSPYLSYGTIWHESAHIYTFFNENSAALYNEWSKIAGDVYTSFYEDYYLQDPSDGLLTWYCRSNCFEDIAEWVKYCYIYLYLDSKTKVFQNNHFRSDLRYRKKLALLKKFGFLKEEDYQKLKPLFE